MAVIPLDTDALRERTLRDRVDRYLTGLGMGFNAYLEARARIAELRRLDRLSDADLARRGLSRDSMVAHVFEDVGGR